MICFVENGLISVAGYRRTLVACANVEKAVIALLSLYYVCSIEYDVKQSLFLQFVLTGESCKQVKKANQLISMLKLE